MFVNSRRRRFMASLNKTLSALAGGDLHAHSLDFEHTWMAVPPEVTGRIVALVIASAVRARAASIDWYYGDNTLKISKDGCHESLIPPPGVVFMDLCRDIARAANLSTARPGSLSLQWKGGSATLRVQDDFPAGIMRIEYVDAISQAAFQSADSPTLIP